MEAKLYKGFTAVMYLLLYSILLIRVESHLTTGIFLYETRQQVNVFEVQSMCIFSDKSDTR